MRIDVSPARETPAPSPPSSRLSVLELVSGFPKLSETFVVDQILGLGDRGAQVDIWALDDPDEPTVAPEIDEHGLLRRTRYVRVPQGAGSVEEWLLTLDRLSGLRPADLERHDVVHVNFGPVYVALAPMIEAADVPVVVSFYGYDLTSFVAAAGPDVYQPMFRRVDAVTAVSESGRQRLVQLGCPSEKAHVLRAGVHPGAPPAETARPGHGPLELVTIARLVEKKGVDDAIAAVARMARPVRLRIIGDGPLRADLERQVAALGVGDRIVFEGAQARSRVNEALAAADAMLQLSRTALDGDQEGIPVALVMAGAAGVPAVTTRHSGIPELVVDEVSGLLVDERDVVAAAGALDRLADDPSLRTRLGRGARQIVERDFDQRRLDDRLHALLATVGRAPRAGRGASTGAAVRRAAVPAGAGECPVCDDIVTFPATGPTAPAPCPSCGASAATRTVVRFLIDRTDVLGADARVLTIDADERLADELTALCGHGHVAVGSGAPLPHDAQPFDLVIPAFGEHEPDVTGAAPSLMATGGWIVAPVPLDAATPAAEALSAAGIAVARHDPMDLWEPAELAAGGLDTGIALLVGARPTHALDERVQSGSHPSVAVTIAAGTSGAQVEETVEAALRQTRPVEAVVVAAGPSVPAMVTARVDGHRRVTVVRAPTDDPAEQRRLLRAHVASDVVAELDAGDVLTDRAVAAVLEAFGWSPDADAVIGDEQIARTGTRIRHLEGYHRPGTTTPETPTFVRAGRTGSTVRHAGRVLTTRHPAAPPAPAPPRRSRSLRIVVRHNPDKAGPLLSALRDAGHELVNDLTATGDVVLTDLYPNHGQIWELMERVGRTILYPHSAWPTLHCDGIYPVHPSIEAYFVVGEGCREVMDAVGFGPPVHTVGWPFGELREMRTTPGRKVLFAAHHPDRLGHLDRRQQIDNERIVDELVDGGFEVTVRHIGTLRENGFRRRAGVTYHEAGVRSAAIVRPAELDLDAADVVVSAGTFAHRAVSLGIPTVTCGQEEWAGDGMRPGQRVRLRTWPRYAHLLRYPYDADTDLAETVRQAASDPGPALEWRRRFIGEPFDAAAFVRRFEEIVG